MLGQHRAAELLLFGEPFGPETAKEFGIVNQIFPEAELWASAGAKAQQLAEKPPAAMRATKALLKSHTSATLAETMQREAKQFRELLQGPEAREAMMAFMERRKPDFSKF
jgi:enoyl-CoA hydratase/carnithine racemase